MSTTSELIAKLIANNKPAANSKAGTKAGSKVEIPLFAIEPVKEKTLSPLQAANKAFRNQSGSFSFCFNGVRKLHTEFRAIVKAKADNGYSVDNDLLNDAFVKGNLSGLKAKLPYKERWTIDGLKAAIIKVACTK